MLEAVLVIPSGFEPETYRLASLRVE